MNKNKLILITLLSLIESNAIQDTIFTYDNDENETLFMTLINELEMEQESFEGLMDAIMDGDQEDLLNELKRLLEEVKKNG